MEERLADADSSVEAQRNLAEARSQVLDLRQEVDRLRSGLEDAHRERRRLQHLLQSTQAVARTYAERLDAAERRRRASGLWPRLAASLFGKRGPPDSIREAHPGATA